MNLQEIVSRAEALTLDMNFRAVSEWRTRTGGHAIGHLPIYAPRELITAAGMLPVGVFGGGDQIEIIRGDAYFQSYICQLPRSVIELALGGRLDCLDGMLFPAICDVIRNLSGMWQMLFPGKLARYVDVPHNHDPEVGGKFYAHELRDLARALTGVSGVEVTDDRLRDAIRVHNDVRRAIRDLYAARAASPHLVPTPEAYAVVRAGMQLPPDEHIALIRQYLDAARTSARPELDQARVILVGSFCEQPPLGLLKTLERAGCYIVDDDLALGVRFITSDIDASGDPWRAMANAWFTQGASTASRYVPNEHKGAYLVEKCRRLRAEGVVFCAPSFCDPALLEQPMLQAALDRAGIQHTAVKYSENTAQFHSVYEQAGTFADSIKLWSEAS